MMSAQLELNPYLEENENETFGMGYYKFSSSSDINIENKKHVFHQKDFPTGSSYEGKWDLLGMSGYGKYRFPHGVIYEGHMKDGQFHKQGCLTYPKGQKLYGTWCKGKLVSWTYRFKEGTDFNQNWNYCKFPDRRFSISLQEGLLPPGEERLTNEVESRVIPEGCYDTGDGFYNPNYKCIFSAYDENRVIRVPNEEEENWIISKCRKAWDEPVGYRPNFNNYWTTGRAKSEEGLLNRKSVKQNSDDRFWKNMQ